MEWRVIDGFNNYEVSDSGKVRHLLPDGSVRYLNGTIVTKKYVLIILRRNGEYYRTLLNRIVAKAFVPNPNGYWTVKHKNGNTLDNSASNLYWVERKRKKYIKNGI